MKTDLKNRVQVPGTEIQTMPAQEKPREQTPREDPKKKARAEIESRARAIADAKILEQKKIRDAKLAASMANASPFSQALREKAKAGLLCQNKACRSHKIKVARTMPRGEEIIVRYRECLICGHTWSTEEKPRAK